MFIIKKKKYALYTLTILVISIFSVLKIMNYKTLQEKEKIKENIVLKEENIKLSKEYQEQLQIVKELEQKIEGQTYRLDELSKEVAHYTELIIKNQEEINKNEE